MHQGLRLKDPDRIVCDRGIFYEINVDLKEFALEAFVKYSPFFQFNRLWNINRGFLFLILAAATAFLIACGDDNGSSTSDPEDSSSSVCDDCENTPISSSNKAKSSSSKKQPKSSSSSKVKSSSSKVQNLSSSRLSSSKEQPQSSSSHENMATMTDERDGQIYKTVTIGTQTWMAENLNYETENSSCYNANEVKCSKYGRFYNWATAMDSAGTWGSNGKGCGYKSTCSPTSPVRGVCPSGWHLPSNAEFNTLFSIIGENWNKGEKLKSTSGWKSLGENNGNGTDDYEFNALPAGFWYVSINKPQFYGYNDQEGEFAKFWTSDEFMYGFEEEDDDGDRAYAMGLSAYLGDADISLNDKYNRISVRCVKDYPTTMTDERDGQTYKIVTIGSQTWMAENLNYETENSYCYKANEVKCSKYGRFYTWAAAMDSTGTWGPNGKGCGYEATCTPTYPVRGVCPSGWHLPSNAEFKTLFTAIGSSQYGYKLKSTSGWDTNDGSSGNGTDDYGFNAMPAGSYTAGSWKYTLSESDFSYDQEGEVAVFWTSDDNDVDDMEKYDYASTMELSYYVWYADIRRQIKYDRNSVRCIKD